ncbi:hypothetical protein PHG25p216nc [Aeromonas phage 25]|uniref:Uncharacterized protein n=1 Tax=Aeromonas phage 25 TaxID=2911441 RepID=Q19CF1_9CAUD|nr:hypothetical protein PHG25p216nc [Aeromonas phage 25]ABF72774.1 hypothetical protein PHG25p216nc [Aeromonas phage 25]
MSTENPNAGELKPLGVRGF